MTDVCDTLTCPFAGCASCEFSGGVNPDDTETEG